MVVVAISGGTGGLGRTITEAIAATGKHKVFVLSRESTDIFINLPNVTLLAVDYTSVDALARVLKENVVDTIISTMQIRNDETSKSQLNLIEAAEKSGTVKRFAPSEFGIDYMEASRTNFPFPFTAYKVAAVEKLRETSLEYAVFLTGQFLDYVGLPKAPTYMQGISVIVDVENMRAAIPGEGNTPMIFTHTADVAKFIAASLDLPKWPRRCVIVGDRITANQLVSLVERARGRKMSVVHDSLQDLRAGKNTELPSNIARYSFFPKNLLEGLVQIFGIAMEEGLFNIKGELLNDILPDIKPMSVDLFLQTYWGSN